MSEPALSSHDASTHKEAETLLVGNPNVGKSAPAPEAEGVGA